MVIYCSELPFVTIFFGFNPLINQVVDYKVSFCMIKIHTNTNKLLTMERRNWREVLRERLERGSSIEYSTQFVDCKCHVAAPGSSWLCWCHWTSMAFLLVKLMLLNLLSFGFGHWFQFELCFLGNVLVFMLYFVQNGNFEMIFATT